MLKTFSRNLIVALGLSAASLLSTCDASTQPYHIREGVMRDTIFSVEQRGSGVVVVWVTHSDKEGYCFVDPELKRVVTGLIDHTGEVIIRYEGQTSGVTPKHDPGKLCWMSELSSTYNINVGYAIKAVPSR